MDTTSSPVKFKRVLITGAAGFVGKHLVKELASHGVEVWTTDKLPAGEGATAALPRYARAEMCSREEVEAVVAAAKPDAVIHLAALSFYRDAITQPERMLAVNIGGTLNVADAIAKLCPKARMFFVSSTRVYGNLEAETRERGLREDGPVQPLMLYAVTKKACEEALFARAAAKGLDVVAVRPANHIGPGQLPIFAVPSFAQQVLECKRGERAEIKVGNLDSARDFSDVRDIVRAYWLLLEKGVGGTVYNISNEAPVSMREILDTLVELSGAEVKVTVDPALWRPGDHAQYICSDRMRALTDWAPRIPLRETLADILEDFSNNSNH